MNAFDIEILRQNLLVNLPITHGKSKVFIFHNFYSSLLKSSDNTLIEAYSLEFIEEYINLIMHYSPFCLPPQKSYDLINQFKEITNLNSLNNFTPLIAKEIERLRLQLEKLNSILYGNLKDEQNLNKLSFPLLEDSMINLDGVYGFLETVRITINKNKHENKLYVFPNTGELEKNLERQVKDSFSLAIKYLNDHRKKFSNYYEIFVYFDNYSANYIGNSLGIALTIGFIEQLTILYNLPFLVNIKSNIASTGGINQEGKILAVNKEFIEKKVEVVFYSPIEIFIVPKEDEQIANEKLNELRELYPQRSLKIIGVTDLEDILNRRNLISVSKQNPIVRSVKASFRNWQVSLLVVILYIIIAVTLFRNFDENPAALENQGNILLVKNKSGRTLWSKNINYDSLFVGGEINFRHVQKIIDIDNNGTNEVIVVMESADELEDPKDYGRIACFSAEGNLIWSFHHSDVNSASEELLHSRYIANLIDTFSVNNKKYLLAMASDNSTSTSMILGLNLNDGKRENTALWHNGLIRDAFIYDFNKDGMQEVAFIAVNNDYGQAALGDIDLNNLSRRYPNGNYRNIDTIPHAPINSYIVLPKIYYFNKLNNHVSNQIKLKEMVNNPAENCIYLSSVEVGNPASAITFKINYDWQKIDIITETGFNIQRDSLVDRDMSKFHLMNKSELIQNFIRDVMYWNGKEFIKKNR